MRAANVAKTPAASRPSAKKRREKAAGALDGSWAEDTLTSVVPSPSAEAASSNPTLMLVSSAPRASSEEERSASRRRMMT